MCSVPPSAQGLIQGHTHSDGVGGEEVRGRLVRGESRHCPFTRPLVQCMC